MVLDPVRRPVRRPPPRRSPAPRRMNVGAASHLAPVVMPGWQAIHAVRPVVPYVDLWECLATCPFVGSREDAIGHAVSHQFTVAA